MGSIESLPKTTFSGRRFTRKQLTRVQRTVEMFSGLSRKELALTVCEHLDWRNPAGSLKVQSCLTMLEALEAQGVITLPAKRITKKPDRRPPSFDQHPPRPAVSCQLASIQPISLRLVRTKEERERWKAYLQSYHYLGYKHPFGAHLGYLIVSEARQEELGCFVFSASASWALAPRDQWIGWEKKQREKQLSLILSNDRFLILPWVEVPHLASHALSLVCKRVANDWVEAHGYRPVLIETFVDSTRYSGASYKAANWTYVGQSKGRGRDDPGREYPETKKDIYLYPLQSDWRQCLTRRERKADRKKRQRSEVRSSQRQTAGGSFVALWEHVVEILHQVAAEYDERWRVRRRVIDSMLLMLLIFRLVTSKGSQGYGTTIDELWDSCHRLKIQLPQQRAISPSSFCAARKKLDASIFLSANQEILAAYAPQGGRYRWRGHRLFAVDGSKLNLPRELIKSGYRTPNKDARYPQGLMSCLYEIRSQLPYDFDLVAHEDERRCALQHLHRLRPGDVVVYDRGYFSYALLHHHRRLGIHAIFRLQAASGLEISRFFSSKETDKIVTIAPARAAVLKWKHSGLDITPSKLRLLKYEIAGSTYCLATTLTEPDQQYPLRDFMDVYHSRWGLEELYKVSKRIIDIEDFHAKSERGVKQEVFAHYVLLTMNRLFANQADLELNGDDPDESPSPAASSSAEPMADEPHTGVTTRIQTNFKHCLHVFRRNLEELLLLRSKLSSVLQRAFASIMEQHRKTRPGRSYPRASLLPDRRWRPSKEKKQQQKQNLTAAANY